MKLIKPSLKTYNSHDPDGHRNSKARRCTEYSTMNKVCCKARSTSSLFSINRPSSRRHSVRKLQPEDIRITRCRRTHTVDELNIRKMHTSLSLLLAFVFAASNTGRMTSGEAFDKESVPLTSMVKQPPDLTKMMERVVAGTEAMMIQLRQLEQQQREQRERLERMGRQQEEERQHQQESLAERQHLKQMISNLTSELTSVEGAVASGQHQTDQQQALRQRVRRELQAMACNVTAELQTVINIAEMTNHRLQQLETRNGELRRQMQQLNEAMTSHDGYVIGNMSSLIAQQLQQQQMNDRLRFATLTESIKAEVRSATCLRQTSGGSNSTRQPQSNITSTPRRLAPTHQHQRLISGE